MLILYGTFNKLRDVSEDYNQPSCNSFLSCDYVNFKEKRSFTSYIQQFTLKCFSLTQFKLIDDKHLSHKLL